METLNLYTKPELAERSESLLNMASAIAMHLKSESLDVDKDYEDSTTTRVSKEVITTEGIRLMLVANEAKDGELSDYELHVLNASKLDSPQDIKFVTQSAVLDFDNQILNVSGRYADGSEDEPKAYYQPISDPNQINYLADMIFTANNVS